MNHTPVLSRLRSHTTTLKQTVCIIMTIDSSTSSVNVSDSRPSCNIHNHSFATKSHIPSLRGYYLEVLPTPALRKELF